MAKDPKYFLYPEYSSNHRNGSFIDTVQPEMYHMVDSYWYQFPPMEPMYFYLISAVITFLGIASIAGNSIVIYIFISTKALRTPSNLYVVNLAISDFMMMFTMFPPVVVNSYYGTWAFGPFVCEIYGLCGSLFGCISIWSNTMIAKDRYNVIVKGLTRKPISILGACFNLFIVWVICGLWAIFPLFGWNRYVPEGNMTACGTDYFAKDLFNQSYIYFYAFWAYMIPLGTIIYSYYYILQAVREHEQKMREQAKKMNVASLRNTDDKNKSVEIKLAKVALCTISLWFIAWTPYSIINFSGLLGVLNLSPLETISGSIFAKANAVYNPIVYGLSHPRYQAALAEKLPCLSCKNPAPAQQESSENRTIGGEVESQAA